MMTGPVPVLALAGVNADPRFLGRHLEALGETYRSIGIGTPATLAHSGDQVVVVLRLSTSALIHRVGRRNPDPVWKDVDLPALLPTPALELSTRHALLAATVAERARDTLLRNALHAFRAADRALSDALLTDARQHDDLAEAMRILGGLEVG